MKNHEMDAISTIPNAPRRLSQAGQSKYTIILAWQIPDNVRADQVAAHAFKVTALSSGQGQFVPATTVRPDHRGWYRHEIRVSGAAQPVYFNVQVRAQALNGQYGPYSPVLVCHTSS
ncbi:hypothetical protein [Pseudomonas citrulli]|uniref:Fibronectin type-III domain-containing protein n=1 Tax=Pseudomonas citrulli TaxID=3064347 RepID=A0ABT9C3P0_9PSED|nr:hypothetical protein [Pseudomonas sp. K18]MDO7899415.1 hypothetical protein [Pseudomonas sp. K18]